MARLARINFTANHIAPHCLLHVSPILVSNLSATRFLKHLRTQKLNYNQLWQKAHTPNLCPPSLLQTLNPDHNLILVGQRSTAIILLGGFQVALQVYLSLSSWCGVTSDGGDAGGNGYWAHGLQQMFEWLATFRDWLSGGHRTPYIKHIRSYSSTKPATNRTRKLFVLRRCSFNTLLPLPKALFLCCMLLL